MVSNQQNLNQVGIDEFLRALRSLGVKKDDISGKPLIIKYSSMVPYSIHQRHSTPIKYEDEEEDDNEEAVRPPSHNHRVNKTRKHHRKTCHREGKAMFTSHPGASLIFSMFINLLIKLLLLYFILFHSFHFF